MTLAVAWERSTTHGSELVFAADSRVRHGGEWDSCPKVFQLPRSDALMAFAGDTLWAYPMVLQTIATMAAFRPSWTRHYDLAAARGHVMRTMTDMMKSGAAATGGWHDINFEFLFGGWSWQEQQFKLWRLYWSSHYSDVRHDSVPPHHLGLVRFIGDRDREGVQPELELVGRAKERLSELLRRKHGDLYSGIPLDMEPFEILLELIRSNDHPTVGGAPQLAKVYRSMNSTVFSVRWPDRRGKLTLLGRSLLDYEKTDAPEIDPDAPSARWKESDAGVNATAESRGEADADPGDGL